MSRFLAVLWFALTPATAAAQPLILGRASLSEALRDMDRLEALSSLRALPRPLEQTLVLPEHPGQNQVSWFDFDWRHYDVPSPSGGKGGIRLYYYGRERAVAERALPVIRNAYLYLVEQFHYTPTKQIPYILYSSQREFQTTNVFEVTESVLGVTSPTDLKMSLAYFGNHELVHQFTIQKLLDLAGDRTSSSLDTLPLWFVEGIAEYYAKGGLDAEADLYLRDLILNPDPERHYEVVSFSDDRVRGYIPTYKLGQARLTFIAEVYGKDKIQDYLENAYLVSSGSVNVPGERGFAALTRRVLNEPVEQVDVRWRAWLRRRYFPAYLNVRQDLDQLREIRDLPAEPEAFQVASDPNVVFFRGIDREGARAKLFLMDARYPPGAVEVAADQEPEIESLHPIEHSVMAITGSWLAFSAQSGPGDVLYLQSFSRRPPEKGKHPGVLLGQRRRLEMKDPSGRQFIEISDPAFSPDGKQLAFVGLTQSGQLDIYVVSSEGGRVRQLTDDPFAERDLAWGKDGIYCASDATDHGHFNLFRVDPTTGARTRLTTGNWDDAHPRPQPDGSVLFSSRAGGKPDLYLLREGRVHRLTDFATGLSAPAAAPAGGIWATTFYRGRFRLVESPQLGFVDAPEVAVAPPTGPPLDIPQANFPPVTPRYDAFSLGNWRPEAAAVSGGAAAAGTTGVGGSAAVLFADALRDRLLYLNLAVLGSFDLTQAVALYEDRSARTARVLGFYHLVNTQIDVVNTDLAFFEREFGVTGTLRFPMSRFQRLELELSLGAVERYCLTDFSVFLPTSCSASPAADPSWHQRNDGVHPLVGPAIRYGYDTLRYHPNTGPLSGNSVLLEFGSNWLPFKGALNGFARADLSKYWQLIGRTNFSLRLAIGSSFAPDEVSRNWERIWWLSSADNLRGYSPFDLAYLIGRNYYVMNAELHVPLDALIHLAIFDYLEAVGAVDFGGVFDRLSTLPGASVKDPSIPPNEFGAWDSRTLTGVLGLNVIFGPLLFRVHFGHPFDIGGIQTPAMRSGTSWVTNFSLRYLFF